MEHKKVEGLVIKKYSGFYYVQDWQQNTFECKLRGKAKKDLILTGDKVIFSILEQSKGIIENILPRHNELYRPRIANISKVFIVMANDRPSPSLSLLDRLLFLAYYNSIEPCLVINKADLAESVNASLIKEYYPKIGIDIVQTSTKTKQGIDKLSSLLKNEIAVLAGPSGVGKSSLLNLLIDGVNLKTQEVSHKIGRGRHTTRHVELFALESGGFLADTPGFSVLDLPKINRNELSQYFPDFSQHAVTCKFSDCLHWKEKDCGVKQAVEKNEIALFRYENYLTMLSEIIEKERCY